MNELIIPASFTEETMGGCGLDLNFFNGENSIATDIIPPPTQERKRRGRPPKSEDKNEIKTKTTSSGDTIVVVDEEDHRSTNLSSAYSNESYNDGFQMGNNIIQQAISQLDELGYQVMEEFNKVKNSQMKSKYAVMPQLASTLSMILSNKISAANNINKTIKDCYDLELKRMKEVGAQQINGISDDEMIMNAYNAYISAPVGAQPFIAPPNMITSTSNTGGIVRASIGNTDDEYANYMQNITPEQNMMQYERDPNVKTVVVYDAADPMNRYFDVINLATGQSIPNVPRPDMMFMENIKIDERNGIARDAMLDRTYPLVVLNANTNLSHY